MMTLNSAVATEHRADLLRTAAQTRLLSVAADPQTVAERRRPLKPV